MVRNDKEASEETKALWKKKCLIAAAVFVFGFIGNELSVSNLTPEERAAQEEQRRIDTADREAKKAEEAKQQEEEKKKAEAEQKRQSALAQRKKEQEQKRKEEAEKQQAWEKQEQERNKYAPCRAGEMLQLLSSNGYAAKQKYQSKFVKISGVQIKWIGTSGNSFLADDGDDFSTHALSVHITSKTKGLSLANLRTDQFVTVYGKVEEVGEVVGTRAIGGKVYGYVITADKIER